MRMVIFFFVALLAIPIAQVVFGPRFERPGSLVLIDRSSKIIIAVGKRLRTRDIEYPMVPRPEWRPKAS
jgi:hypothetical protein